MKRTLNLRDARWLSAMLLGFLALVGCGKTGSQQEVEGAAGTLMPAERASAPARNDEAAAGSAVSEAQAQAEAEAAKADVRRSAAQASDADAVSGTRGKIGRLEGATPSSK